MNYLPEAGAITVFSTDWCGDCIRLKAQLKRNDIPFTEVNIEEVPGTEELITTLNNGRRALPTVLYPDGSAAAIPSLADIQAKLEITEPEPEPVAS